VDEIWSREDLWDSDLLYVWGTRSWEVAFCEPYSRYSGLQSILIQALGSDVVCFVVGLKTKGMKRRSTLCNFRGAEKTHSRAWA
jgi:hypothetical protein